MALIRPHLDYTDRDFDALRVRIHNLVDSAFPDWTEKEVANFGNILLDLYAFVGDVLGYYQDRQANESSWSAAQLRRSLLALARRIGYRPSGAAAAVVQVTFSLSDPPVGDLKIRAGDRFATRQVGDPVTFQALEESTIPAGLDPPVIVFEAEHSESRQEVFQSTGKPNQAYVLGGTPYLDDSLTVEAADGSYSVVETFLDAGSEDRVVTVQVDANDRARVVFGNAVNGTVPQGTITFGYKVGGGKAGNVDPGTVTRALRTYSDELGNPVRVTVTNEGRGVGGAPRQTVESIRQEGPRSLRALTRSVANEDFEAHALKVPSVGRALMLTRNEVPWVDENAGRLVVVPKGGGLPTQAMKDAVRAKVTTEFPHTTTFVVEVVDPDYLAVDVYAVVFPKYGAGTVAQNAALDAAIRGNLADLFALELSNGDPNPDVDFGLRTDALVAKSDVGNAIRDAAQVRRLGDDQADLLLNGVPQDLAVQPHQLPQLGAVTLINGYTAQPLVSA